MKLKQTAIRIEDEMKDAAIVRAKSQERSLGSYIRALIKADLQKAAQSLAESGKADLEKAAKLKKGEK